MEVFGGIILSGNSFTRVIMFSFQEGMPAIPTRQGRILVLTDLVKTLAGEPHDYKLGYLATTFLTKVFPKFKEVKL